MAVKKIDGGLIQRAGDMIFAAWRTMPRERLNWAAVSEIGLESLSKKTANFSKHYDWGKGLNECIEEFHKKTTANIHNDKDLWGGDHNVAFEKLDRNHRLNLTSIVLACNIASIANVLSTSPFLPRRNMQDLEHYMSTKIDWFWDRRNKTSLFDKNFSVESSVRGQIENTWRNLQKDSNLDLESLSLRWENVAICAIDAVYTTISRLEEANNPDKFKIVCQKTHELMIKHKLWGDDSGNSDRAYSGGDPKNFDELSPEMKENYVIIVLAALSGIGDFMVDSKPVPA